MCIKYTALPKHEHKSTLPNNYLLFLAYPILVAPFFIVRVIEIMTCHSIYVNSYNQVLLMYFPANVLSQFSRNLYCF